MEISKRTLMLSLTEADEYSRKSFLVICSFAEL